MTDNTALYAAGGIGALALIAFLASGGRESIGSSQAAETQQQQQQQVRTDGGLVATQPAPAGAPHDPNAMVLSRSDREAAIEAAEEQDFSFSGDIAGDSLIQDVRLLSDEADTLTQGTQEGEIIDLQQLSSRGETGESLRGGFL